MRWYFAINEAGTRSEVGLHAKLAVASALNRTNLDAVMLYTGQRNDFTAWMESKGVAVIPVELPFERRMREIDATGRHSMAYLGHWLRSAICNLERESDLVLYTDCDVVFLSEPEYWIHPPSKFACAPEFQIENWNYINTGVMAINVSGLRADYPAFEDFVVERLEAEADFNDQAAYNRFYRGKWDRLDPKLNWKPYWGECGDATILHFHGPKLGAIRSICDGAWNWETPYGRQIGSLFVGHPEGYASALAATCLAVGHREETLSDSLADLSCKMRAFAPGAPTEKVDLEFMNFRLFGS